MAPREYPFQHPPTSPLCQVPCWWEGGRKCFVDFIVLLSKRRNGVISGHVVLLPAGVGGLLKCQLAVRVCERTLYGGRRESPG